MPSYLHGHAESDLRTHRWRTATNSAAYLLPHLRPGLDLLDVGCGPGSLTADLAGRVAPGRVVGVDSAPAPIEEARAAAEAAGVGVELVGADATALDLPDASFDVVHAHQVLQHVPDPVALLREMARVTRSGGLIAVREADYAAMTWALASPGLDRWLATYRATARGTGGEPDAGRALLGWVQQAGLGGDVTSTASAWCFATPQDRQWWGGAWAERAVRSTFAVQAVQQGHATPKDLQDISAAFRAWTQAPDGWWAVLHAEVLVRVP